MDYISDLLPEEIFKSMIHGKFKIKKNENKIEFRNSSAIELNKKPCPCMANKVKESPSS